MSQQLHPTRRPQDVGPLPGLLVCHHVHLVMSTFLFFLFFHSTLYLGSPRATIYQINTPPNLHNLPRLPTPSVPDSLNCVASQLPQKRSKLPLPKAQCNCPVIVHSSTAHEGGGHRLKGGGWQWVAKTMWKSRRCGSTVSSVSMEDLLQIWPYGWAVVTH